MSPKESMLAMTALPKREQFRKLRKERKRRTDEGETDLVWWGGGGFVKRLSKESAPGATSQGSDCH